MKICSLLPPSQITVNILTQVLLQFLRVKVAKYPPGGWRLGRSGGQAQAFGRRVCLRLQIPRCSNSRPLQSGLPLVTDCSWLPTAEWRALGSVTNWHEQPPPQASPPNHPLNSSHRRHPHAWPPWVFPVSDVPGGVTEHQPIHFLGVQDVCRQVGFLCGGGDSGSGKSLGLFVSSDKIYTIQPSGSFTKQSNFMVLGK